MNGSPVTVAIIGLGARGKDAYAPFCEAFPDEMKLVAAADSDQEKLRYVMDRYSLRPENCFSSGEELLSKERLSDALMICTPDRTHVALALSAIEKGYHILLEKPISSDAEECIALERFAKEKKRIVFVCHVLRYTPFYQFIKNVVSSGKIGEPVSIMAIENVCYWHQAHSFVRGNWRNSKESNPMILAKSCHDMDLLVWLMGKNCKRVSSFGGLYHFRAENAPPGAAARCLDGCAAKKDCLYDVEKIYLDSAFGARSGKPAWPTTVLAVDPTEENVISALHTGPYGRCVYYCDNNVVDHQVVNLEFDDGSTAGFTMCAFTSDGGRQIKIMGTRGDLVGDMNTNIVTVGLFGREKESYDITKFADDFSGHGGGDNAMLHEFVQHVRTGNEEGLTAISQSIQSHLIALAAEESRIKGGEPVCVYKEQGI